MGGTTSRPVFSSLIGTYDLYHGQSAEQWLLSIEGLCEKFPRIDSVVFITKNLSTETQEVVDSVKTYMSQITGGSWKWTRRTLRTALILLEDQARAPERKNKEPSKLMKGVLRVSSTIESTMKEINYFRRSNPATCTLIGAGVGAGSYLFLHTPEILKDFGFDEEGIRKGSPAARYQSKYRGNVPRESFFSYGQSLSRREPSFLAEQFRNSLDWTRNKRTQSLDEYHSVREEDAKRATVVDSSQFNSNALLLNALLTIRQQEEDEGQAPGTGEASSTFTVRSEMQDDENQPRSDTPNDHLIDLECDTDIRPDTTGRGERSPFDDPEDETEGNPGDWFDPANEFPSIPMESLRHSPPLSTESLLNM